MKRRIIKEQAATTPGKQEIVSPTKAKHDNLLQLTLKYCTLNHGYTWVEHPDMKVEVLGRPTNDGYNYIFNKDNKVFLEKRGPGNTILNQPSVLDDCQTLLSKYQPNPLTDTQEKFMADEAPRLGYEINRPSEAEIANGTWEEIDMSRLNPNLFTNPGGAFLYKQKNIKNKYFKQYPAIELRLGKANYTFQEPDRGEEAQYNTGRKISTILGSSYKNYFGEDEPYVYIKSDKMGKDQFDTEKIKKECKVAIKTLYNSFKNPEFPEIKTLEDRILNKTKVHYCKFNKNFASGILGLGTELDTLYTKSEEQNPFGMKNYNPTKKQNENTHNLKNLIRESLLEIKKTKEKNVLSEGKIVKSRLSIISENVNFKTKKQKDKFFDELLSEMVYLNSQGFDKQVINEGFFDMVKSLLGHSPDAIMEYFKEYMAKWLVNNLTPVDPEGWFGNMIITGVGNLPIGDIPKLTDCNYLTKWISKSAAEGTVRKLTHEKGLDGPFYDVLRNAIVDMLDETSLGSKIEEALGSFICPLLGGVKNKMEATTDKLKQKALSTS